MLPLLVAVVVDVVVEVVVLLVNVLVVEVDGVGGRRHHRDERSRERWRVSDAGDLDS